MKTRAKGAKGDHINLELGELLGFTRGSEFVLIHARLGADGPNKFVVTRLRKVCPAIQVASVAAFALADAPPDLRETLVPQLRAHGLSDLWFPYGYYLFHRGELLGYRNTTLPRTCHRGRWLRHPRPSHQWSLGAGGGVLAGLCRHLPRPGTRRSL